MKTFLYKIRHFFVNDPSLKTELRRVLLSFQVMVFGICALILFIILDSLIGTKLNLIADFVLLIVLLFSMSFMVKGYFKQSNIVMIIATNFVLLINASIGGTGISSYFLWFPLSLSVFIFFSFTDKIIITFLLLLIFLSILFVFVTDNSLFLQNDFDFKKYISYDLPLSFFISFVLNILLVMSLIKTNYQIEKKSNTLVRKLNNSNIELLKSNTELDSFVYKASHDLRSPLTSIMGLLALMKDEDDKQLLTQYIEIQEKAVLKLDNHIVDILNISKNARMGLSIDDIDFEKIIKEIFAQHAYSDNLKIDMKVNVSATSPFFTDKKRLGVVLGNLIANSVKYIDFHKPNPEITVKVVANSKLASISVHDNGIGIDAEYCKKVFEMFFRASNTRSGSGLGLYIVNETVQKLQGKIKLHSEIGQWTEFTLLIPNLLYKKMLENQNNQVV